MQNFFRERKKDISFVNITWSLSTLAKLIIAKKQNLQNEENFDYYFFDGVRFCARMKMITSMTKKSTKETYQNRLDEKPYDFDEKNMKVNECKWKLKLSRFLHWWKNENYICAELGFKVFRTFDSGLIMRRILIETYIWVGSPVNARADEGDELMTTLVNHKAANWGKIFLFLAFNSFIFLDYWEAPEKGAHQLTLFRIRI